MFDYEKIDNRYVVVHILSPSQYNEMKMWCKAKSIDYYFPDYYNNICLNFYANHHDLYDYYDKMKYTILSLDDIRLDDIVQFDEIILVKGNVIHCETEEQSLNLFKWADNKGLKTGTGQTYSKDLRFFHGEGRRSYYHLNEGSFGDVTYNSMNRKIFKYEDVVIKKTMYTVEDLKKEHIGVLCKTKEEAIKFDKFTDESRSPSDKWVDYKEDTIYDFSSSGKWYYGTIKSYENYIIINVNQIKTETIKEKKEMKYKLAKELSGQTIVENACHTQFELFINKYGYYKSIEWTQENEDFIIEQKGWITFFLDNGFIKLNKEKIEYIENYIYVIKSSGTIYKLTRVHESYMFCALSSTFAGYNGQFSVAQKAIDDAQSDDEKVEVFTCYSDFKEWLKDN